MTPRHKYTKAERAEIFLENDGRCHICSRRIALGELWHVEHEKPRWLKGKDHGPNLRVAHVDCHAGKTRKEAKIRARNNGARISHVGLKEPSRAWRKSIPRIRQINEEADPDT